MFLPRVSYGPWSSYLHFLHSWDYRYVIPRLVYLWKLANSLPGLALKHGLCLPSSLDSLVAWITGMCHYIWPSIFTFVTTAKQWTIWGLRQCLMHIYISSTFCIKSKLTSFTNISIMRSLHYIPWHKSCSFKLFDNFNFRTQWRKNLYRQSKNNDSW
jgi:hypothetical protein